MAEVATRHDITVQQVALLRMLDEPMSMRAFALDLSCDPSNVTGLVDRAERAGLVARVPDPRDRRVRMLTLTSKGRRTRDLVNSQLIAVLGTDLGSTSANLNQVALMLRTVSQGLCQRA
jgi:DNA-binding MarR family transcriptional regulator